MTVQEFVAVALMLVVQSIWIARLQFDLSKLRRFVVRGEMEKAGGTIGLFRAVAGGVLTPERAAEVMAEWKENKS